MKKLLQDTTGRTIRTGDVVRITGAYFKHDNATYKVTHSPGDEDWNGHDYCLHKIKRDGTLSIAKYHLAFWPLTTFTNSWRTRMEANEHNQLHARIEIIDDHPGRDEPGQKGGDQ